MNYHIIKISNHGGPKKPTKPNKAINAIILKKIQLKYGTRLLKPYIRLNIEPLSIKTTPSLQLSQQ